MTSEKKIAANRRNAQKSTGPRSSAGKRRTSSNAYRHGLTAGVTSSAKDAERIERLAREIAGSATDVLTLEYARDAAQAELDLAQIRRVKIALIERMSAFGEFRARGFDLEREIKLFFRGRGRGRLNAPILVEPAPAMPAAEPERLAEAVCRALPELLKLDRYERRAASRRDQSVRALKRGTNYRAIISCIALR